MRLLTALSAALLFVASASAEVLQLDYAGGFTIWVDCEKRGAVKFRYNAQHDAGDYKRSSSFHLDPDVPAECQQKSTGSYRREEGEKPTYDRGHLGGGWSTFGDDPMGCRSPHI